MKISLTYHTYLVRRRKGGKNKKNRSEGDRRITGSNNMQQLLILEGRGKKRWSGLAVIVVLSYLL